MNATAPTQLKTLTPGDLLDIINVGIEGFGMLEGLFKAIRKLSDEYSTVESLGLTGTHLAQDFLNQLDVVRGEYCRQSKLPKEKTASA